jgi:IS5 family transposase
MNKQVTISTLTDELGQAATHKKEFLKQMDRIIPWSEWKGIIELHYYKGERGNKPFDLELMLRIHLVQNLYNLSDMVTMMEIIDSRAFSEFYGGGFEQPDTGRRYHRAVSLATVEHGLQEKLFAQVVVSTPG